MCEATDSYSYRPGHNDSWEVFKETDADGETIEDWVANVSTETIARKLVEILAPPPMETYPVLVLSTAHLSSEDIERLNEEAADSDEWMVMNRKPGFFIKLYSDGSSSNLRHGHSETIKGIIKYAMELGFNMIEFDRDAEVLDIFPVYQH